MSEEDGIRRTIAEYAHLCDDGRFDEWADLYTEEARFSVMGQTHVGRDQIKAFIVAAQPPEARGTHVCFNTVIDLTDDGASARAVTDYMFLSRTDSGGYQSSNPISAGRYYDRLVREPDRWRFAERRIVFMGDPLPSA